MKKIICNKCGKEIGRMAAESSLHYEGTLGYASSYDGLQIEIDLCPKCFEELIDSCKIDPSLWSRDLKEAEEYGCGGF